MQMQSQQFMHLSVSPLQGLSEEEVVARRAQGLGNVMPVKTSRSYAQIVRENIFNPLNTLLYILGLALIMLGKVSDALISVGVVVLNVSVSVIQEVRAKRTLDHIALLTRPRTTVIRAGQEQSVDPGDIVVGDVLLVRPGDQIVVDGPVLSTDRLDVDESLLTGESDLVEKRKGDHVYSGSFCVNGSALYQAEKVGAQSVAFGLAAGARAFRRIYTPLQREIFLVIRVILLAAIFLELLMVLSTLTKDISFVEFVQRSVVIVGIVPIGLLLAITVSYTLGAVRIVRQKALVQQSNAIESLSNVDVLCMDKTGTLTTNALELSAVYPLHGEDASELRQLLGDFVASGTIGNVTSKAIGAACPGQQRHVQEEIPFSSAHKWSGLAIDDGAMRGVYILGAVEMLEPALSFSDPEQLLAQVQEASEKGLRVLMFASFPELVPLRRSDDQPVLPKGLIPLGLVILRDQLRPEAQETLKQFTQAGIQFKVISGDNAQTVAALAKQVGLSEDIGIISGLDLAQMESVQFSQAAKDATIFGRITPQQKEQLVQTLRERGHYVAMIGDGVNDVLSLKKANLGIAMQSGSQATRNVADIVLLNDSFSSLPTAFREGQRIRHGMRGILSLFLARVLYVALLIIEILMIGEFPLAPKQVSILTFLTVGAPALVLATWGYPGTSAGKSLGNSLWHFVLPASLTISIVALFVFLGEYYVTLLLRIITLMGEHTQPLSEAAALAAAVPVARVSAQTGLTTFAVLCGIILILFVEPPSKFWVGGHQLHGDKRAILLAFAMFVAYVILLVIPPLRNLFDLALLGFFDYLFIGILVVLWIFVVRWFWHSRLLERFLASE
jgi:cation-transporting P-type ATPase E